MGALVTTTRAALSEKREQWDLECMADDKAFRLDKAGKRERKLKPLNSMQRWYVKRTEEKQERFMSLPDKTRLGYYYKMRQRQHQPRGAAKLNKEKGSRLKGRKGKKGQQKGKA